MLLGPKICSWTRIFSQPNFFYSFFLDWKSDPSWTLKTLVLFWNILPHWFFLPLLCSPTIASGHPPFSVYPSVSFLFLLYSYSFSPFSYLRVRWVGVNLLPKFFLFTWFIGGGVCGVVVVVGWLVSALAKQVLAKLGGGGLSVAGFWEGGKIGGNIFFSSSGGL